MKIKIQRNYETKYESRDENNKKIIQGYAVIFDEWTEINSWGESFNECVKKGAFKESINNNSILALYNHDFNNVLARKDVNMKIFEDDKGLKFEIELPGTTGAKDLYELIERGIVNQCSFSGFVKDDSWHNDKDKVSREIKKVDLIEITITPIPAYEVTEAEVKRSKEVIKDKKDSKQDMDFSEIIKKSKEQISKIDRIERGF